MVVAQDWSSADVLARPPDSFVAERGFDPTFPTNRQLDKLLLRHFGMTRDQCYLTNLFPFIKSGGASASIPFRMLVNSARLFTMREIEIVAPGLVICLGLRTFGALRVAASQDWPMKMERAIDSPFLLSASRVHCVAHTGSRGMNNRGRDKVDLDWQRLAKRLVLSQIW